MIAVTDEKLTNALAVKLGDRLQFAVDELVSARQRETKMVVGRSGVVRELLAAILIDPDAASPAVRRVLLTALVRLQEPHVPPVPRARE